MVIPSSQTDGCDMKDSYILSPYSFPYLILQCYYYYIKHAIYHRIQSFPHLLLLHLFAFSTDPPLSLPKLHKILKNSILKTMRLRKVHLNPLVDTHPLNI